MNRLDYNKYSSPAAQAMFALEKAIGGLGFDVTIKELVKTRVSQLNGCIFCVDMHVKEARLHHERELRLHHLAVWHESPLFSDKEKAALRWAELLTQFKSEGVSDDEYEKALKFFSEKEL